MGHLTDDSLTPQRAASKAAHLGVGPRFIDEDQLMGMQMRLPVTPGSATLGDVGAILLSRPQDFF